jgi:hypothetical protein
MGRKEGWHREVPPRLTTLVVFGKRITPSGDLLPNYQYTQQDLVIQKIVTLDFEIMLSGISSIEIKYS